MATSNVILYTTGQMSSMSITSATSAATGYPKENIIDNNPDTFWKPTSTADNTLRFDFGSAKTVEAIILFVQNYTAFIGASVFGIYRSTDASSWTQVGSNVAVTNGGASPLRIVTASLGISYRYWEIRFSSMEAVIQLSEVFFCRSRSIGRGYEFPDKQKYQYRNNVFESANGRIFVAGRRRNSFSIMPRKFKLENSTLWDTLKAAFDDSAGRRYPLIFQEGATDASAKLVRFADDELVRNETTYNYFQPEVEFVELPYIDSEQVY